MITIAQCRAARGLLDWTQQDLAEASGLSKTAINNFEKGHSDIKNESLRAIRIAFESADIEFLEDGLRKKNDATQILKGPTAFIELLDDILDTSGFEGEVLMGRIPETIRGHVPSKKLQEYFTEMKKRGISHRVLCHPNLLTMMQQYPAETRSLPAETLNMGMSTFIYDSKMAFTLWNNEMIVVLNSAEAARAERQRFEWLWSTARPTALHTGQSLKKK